MENLIWIIIAVIGIIIYTIMMMLIEASGK